jgi:hypothetical protein
MKLVKLVKDSTWKLVKQVYYLLMLLKLVFKIVDAEEPRIAPQTNSEGCILTIVLCLLIYNIIYILLL